MMKLLRNGSTPSRKGPAETFTGVVRVDSPFQAEAPGRAGGAIMTFEPGARTHWHTHPLGQRLIVTSGVDWMEPVTDEQYLVGPAPPEQS